MPTRLIREGILDSDAVNGLSLRGEVFYRRLMSVADDHGRFDGRIMLLRSRLFALQLERWSEDDVSAAVEECHESGLILAYSVKGKPYLQIERFGQRPRSSSKFPSPPGREDEQRDLQDGKVYFIRATESGRIKIGFSSWKVESRLSALQTGTPERLELIGWITGSREDEKGLHRKFKHLGVGGEWFEPAEELLKYISQCDLAGDGAPLRAVARRSAPYSDSDSDSDSETNAEAKAEAKADEEMALAAPKISLGEFGWVKITEHEHAKLQDDLGPHLPEYVARFDDWVEENPNAKASGGKRKDRSPYLSIRAWFRKDKAEGKLPKVTHGHSTDQKTDALAEAARRRAARRAGAQVDADLLGDLPDVRGVDDSREGGPLLRIASGSDRE